MRRAPSAAQATPPRRLSVHEALQLFEQRRRARRGRGL